MGKKLRNSDLKTTGKWIRVSEDLCANPDLAVCTLDKPHKHSDFLFSHQELGMIYYLPHLPFRLVVRIKRDKYLEAFVIIEHLFIY